MSSFFDMFSDTFFDTFKELFSMTWRPALVLFILWVILYTIFSIRSCRCSCEPGKFYRLVYNPILDRFTLNGVIVKSGELLQVIFPYTDPDGQVHVSVDLVVLKPTLFYWTFKDPVNNMSVGSDIVGHYARKVDTDANE